MIQRSERVLPLLTAVLSALVVDDYVQVQALAGGAFAHERIHCEFASDGAQAHTTLEGTRYQVVVTDLRMPKVNGHALCRTVLALPHRPWLVAITAVGEPRLRDLEARGVAAVFDQAGNGIGFVPEELEAGALDVFEEVHVLLNHFSCWLRRSVEGS